MNRIIVIKEKLSSKEKEIMGQWLTISTRLNYVIMNWIQVKDLYRGELALPPGELAIQYADPMRSACVTHWLHPGGSTADHTQLSPHHFSFGPKDRLSRSLFEPHGKSCRRISRTTGLSLSISFIPKSGLTPICLARTPPLKQLLNSFSSKSNHPKPPPLDPSAHPSNAFPSKSNYSLPPKHPLPLPPAPSPPPAPANPPSPPPAAHRLSFKGSKAAERMSCSPG